MPIAYKVVTHSCQSTCTAALINCYHKYKLTYSKGVKTIPPPGTLGIFVFKSRMAAEKYMFKNNVFGYNIIRVKTGALVRQQHLSWFPDQWDKANECTFKSQAPAGTYVTPWVVPLE